MKTILWSTTTLLILLLRITASAKQLPEPEKPTFFMTAKAWKEKEKRTLLYTERHKAWFRSGNIHRSENEYFSPGGSLIATLNCDYSRSIRLPEYTFRDLRSGYQEGLRIENNKYTAYFKEPGDAEESEPVTDTKDLFSGQGWHYFLRKNLPGPDSPPLHMRLLFPSRLDHFDFRILVLQSAEKTVLLRLEFASWIIRMFAPHLDLIYEKNSGKLLSFYGPSNLKDKQGNTQNVWIFYD